jgi:hypothetical protein
LIRLAFSSVLIHGFTGYSGVIVPLLFPNQERQGSQGDAQKSASFS